jgi:hypothetical protein
MRLNRYVDQRGASSESPRLLLRAIERRRGRIIAAKAGEERQSLSCSIRRAGEAQSIRSGDEGLREGSLSVDPKLAHSIA